MAQLNPYFTPEEVSKMNFKDFSKAMMSKDEIKYHKYRKSQDPNYPTIPKRLFGYKGGESTKTRNNLLLSAMSGFKRRVFNHDTALKAYHYPNEVPNLIMDVQSFVDKNQEPVKN